VPLWVRPFPDLPHRRSDNGPEVVSTAILKWVVPDRGTRYAHRELKEVSPNAVPLEPRMEYLIPGAESHFLASGIELPDALHQGASVAPIRPPARAQELSKLYLRPLAGSGQ
jgi:hypothetical protein